MRRLFFILALLCLAHPALAEVEYQLDVELQPEQQRLEAVATVSGPIGADFRLSENCTVATVRGPDGPLSYQFSGNILSVKSASSDILSISYSCVFNDTVPAAPIHNEDPSYGVSATISDAGTYISGGVYWYPRPADEKINYRVRISAAPGIEAITSGRLIERQTDSKQSRSTWQVDYPLFGLTLSAGRYQVFEKQTDTVPIYAYFYPQSANLAPVYLQATAGYLKLYQELFGPYPFHKFAIVENFFPTGYGLPSWTLLGSSVIKLPFIVKTSLGHELAHSWWGTGVRVDYRQGNWSEGLATYVADYLYQERSSKAEARAYRLKVLRDYASLVNAQNVFPLSQFRSRYDKASQAIGYGKAMMVFHMIRQRIGDQAFWESLRTIVRQRLFTSVGWADFIKTFSSVSGQSLEPFIEPWLQRTQGPFLQLDQVKKEQTPEGWVISGQLRQQPAYQLDVPVRIETAAGESEETVRLRRDEQSFEFEIAARPTVLAVDPDAMLFRILSPEEIPPTVNAIRGSENLLVVLAEQHRPTTAAVSMLLGALRKTDVTQKTTTELSSQDLAKHDLLVFGCDQSLFPREIIDTATAKVGQLPGEQVDLSRQSLFVVTHNPYNTQKNIAWFLSEDLNQDDVVARKIPHYGKYSYLLFDGATKRLAGVWEVKNSPLRKDFATAPAN